MQNRRYPNVYIRSKNELAKQLSHEKFSAKESLSLINDVSANFDDYWTDHLRMSEPKKGKFVKLLVAIY